MLNKHEQTDIKTRIKSREIHEKESGTPAPAEMGVSKSNTLPICGKVTAFKTTA
jgi:hypothetical protein